MNHKLHEIKDRIKINFKYIKSWFIKMLGLIFGLIGFISVFINVQEYLPSDDVDKIKIIMLIFICLFGLSIIYNLFLRKATIKSASGKEFYLSYGNIFKDKSAIKVIPVNRCFDTVVNDSLVSEKTLHGQFINKYFKNNPEVLDELIRKSLRKYNYEYDCIESEDKREGNRNRYPFGSVAEVKYKDKIYYLLALTEFDENLNAHFDVEQYTKVINSLMIYYNRHSQGRDICIPLLGSGDMSRFNKRKQYMLETIVALIKINDDKICGNINVIVYNRDKNDVSISNLL